MDVGACILDYVGTEADGATQARSLRGVARGRENEHRSIAVSESAGHACVIDKHCKAEFDEEGVPTLLFNRQTDPQELQNLAPDLRSTEKLAELRQLFHGLRVTTRPMNGVLLENR